MAIYACFHPPLLCEFLLCDKQLVALIFQSGAIKSLQKKRAQHNDIIKSASVILQTVKEM